MPRHGRGDACRLLLASICLLLGWGLALYALSLCRLPPVLLLVALLFRQAVRAEAEAPAHTRYGIVATLLFLFCSKNPQEDVCFTDNHG
jgi:hypothetical protein